MKKIIIPLMLAAILACAAFSGCGRTIDDRTTSSTHPLSTDHNLTDRDLTDHNLTDHNRTSTDDHSFGEDLSRDVSERLSDHDMLDPNDGRISDTRPDMDNDRDRDRNNNR